MKEEPLKVAILGAGGVGAWIAKMMRERGHEVLASTGNDDTRRALELLGVGVNNWRWSRGVSWKCWLDWEADVWCVTIPPRGGQEEALSFHQELQHAVQLAKPQRLIWTSSTAVYGRDQSGIVSEEDAIHIASRHTGVDMLALEKVHTQSTVPFVAMRFGGLFGPSRHPVAALLKRIPVKEADGTVQWVHEVDAAAACVHVALHPNPGSAAINVVAPHVADRRSLIAAALSSNQWPDMEAGGRHRVVQSSILESLGYRFLVPDPEVWVRSQPALTTQGCWEGPYGRLHWTRHASGSAVVKGRALMVHGYKGFRDWGNWKGLAQRWAEEGWEVTRMDFSHNGHVPPFSEDCLDEEAWSANRYHMERDEVALGLSTLSEPGIPMIVFGHSRGGAMAILGAHKHIAAGGELAGVVACAPVSNVVERLPKGEFLGRWKATNRMEVVNGRTGQVLSHPFAFYQETMSMADELNVETAVKKLTCPVLVVHGDEDNAVDVAEGRDIADWAADGTFHLVQGGNHVFGMKHPWPSAREWPDALEVAWSAQQEWLNKVLS